MHSLRTKITFLAVLVTVFTVVMIALLSVVSIRDAEHQQSEQLLFLLCETGEQNLDYYFRSIERSVQKIAAYTQKDLDGLDDEKLSAHTERIKAYFDEAEKQTENAE